MKWYKYNTQNLSDTEYIKWYSLMREEKKNRVDKNRFLIKKKQTVAGEMLARKAISQWCNVPPESIVFFTKEHNKPYAKDLNVEFNISHSGDMVVCAVSNTPIGIDIEKIRPIDLKIAKRFCNEEELKYLFGFAPRDEDFSYTENKEILTRFFSLWTAKEAYGKCVGDGLASINMPRCKEVKTCIIENEYIVSIVSR